MALEDKVDRIEEAFEDFEYGYAEPATAENVDTLEKNIEALDSRIDRVESKLDQLARRRRRYIGQRQFR